MSRTDSTKTSGQQQVKKSLISPLKEAFNQLTKSYRFYISNEEQIIDIVIDLPSHTDLVIAISRVLQVASKDYPIDQNPRNYEAYIAKKNGRPKTDLPSYQIDLRLEETQNSVFSLVHVTFQERKPKRKSTYDYTNNYSPIKPEQTKDIDEIKGQKNWFLRFLGCG
ncbi:unnamed protein product (macronuclear) [Paramecium tetraurelia]|uniref:Sin1 middle CRIM domain-containing protein n=1 Tax=Paramecium tetraurelia TaxID=5888 RepID=A0CWK6_PARTE|nr:uncharacterized protein GSPATT00001376001 [Paramecium tetraurelia]CAK75173.1 unnamed protein product [Paramecium tetraurelia]|eukprot:XP_001442570.1 hypothetical protein (macronuclear) [Paramecium tetraurelia strain d4-2]